MIIRVLDVGISRLSMAHLLNDKFDSGCFGKNKFTGKVICTTDLQK